MPPSSCFDSISIHQLVAIAGGSSEPGVRSAPLLLDILSVRLELRFVKLRRKNVIAVGQFEGTLWRAFPSSNVCWSPLSELVAGPSERAGQSSSSKQLILSGVRQGAEPNLT